MSDQSTTSKSWGSTVVIGIIILVLAIGLIFFIYYIFLQTTISPYPISPFNFGDTVQISPAVFVRKNQTIKTVSPNQYLVKNSCDSFPCENCYQPMGAPSSGSCVTTFSGNPENSATKWVLEQFPYTEIPKQSTDQNVLAFGNRFYLRNSTNKPTDLAGRVRMNLFDATNLGSCSQYSPDKSFTITSPNLGSDNFDDRCYDPDTTLNRGNELVVYFWPSTQPDLYYMLFPGSLDTETRGGILGNPTLTSRPNNGVVTLRPFAPFENDENYNPKMTNGDFYENGMLLNSQGNYQIGEKYPNPEIFLFKVVKV